MSLESATTSTGMPLTAGDGPVDLRVIYASAVYGQEEVDAVLGVLNGDGQGLAIGANVAEMERRVAALSGKSTAAMCNSGSSALYLAVELLDLPPGSEVISSPLTFSTDLAPLIRAGLVPVFADIERDTFQVDPTKIEEMIGPETKAMLIPNLNGNAPDWDAIRALADQYNLKVIEDSCDALGAKLRGTPTGTRSDISVTSFALAHIVTCAGQGGMVMLDDEELRDRCLSLRRWGRRSEVQMFGTKRGRRSFWEVVDGINYDSLFIFDHVAWNFEPSELGASFGVQQLNKLSTAIELRNHNFDRYDAYFEKRADLFIRPRTTPDLETAWMAYSFIISEDAPFERSDLQQYLEQRNIDTRTVWTGNATRQPMMKGRSFRQPKSGMPNADRVMERGMYVSVNHGLTDEAIDYVCTQIDDFIRTA